jgi:hypothetical protein
MTGKKSSKKTSEMIVNFMDIQRKRDQKNKNKIEGKKLKSGDNVPNTTFFYDQEQEE